MKDPNIYGLVLAPTFLATFTDKPLVDPATAIQVQTAVSRESRAAVDELAGKALASGGKGPCAAQDLASCAPVDVEGVIGSGGRMPAGRRLDQGSHRNGVVINFREGIARALLNATMYW
ncbi:VOC family protein [Arthrobacter wenxiniae]|uniref:Uncharacterized protein n=1 Tax=Arthrobacter wenxiniae TaxID=2713570 RepID=A0A7Y7IDB7_9MICC|nr:hypothetical protein [Arthrobacter wenxiniae]NVM93409.1 hypothetical protein [Arthrobacter wenxiniae]